MPTNSYRLRLFAASLLIAFLECTTFSTAQARRASKDSGSGATVVIDAGHGGYDRGGIPGQRVAEKEMTLDVAQRLKKVLAASGCRVVMTRDGDVFVPLGTRVAIANSYSNAIFVSIHYFVAGGAPSSNRNVRRRGYYVLRKTAVPAVLVECGFLTNPTEAAYAQTASYRQKLAEEIAAGVRGRNTVASTLATTRVATGENIPLQPYIDQTKVAKSERHRSKRSHKKSTRRKKKSSKPAGSEAKAASKDQEG